MNTVILVPGPSTEVLMSHECTMETDIAAFNALMRSRRSKPIGDSNPDRPPISVMVDVVLGIPQHVSASVERKICSDINVPFHRHRDRQGHAAHR